MFRKNKEKFSDCVALFGVDRFYYAYNEDADACKAILGLSVGKPSYDDEVGLERMVQFPSYALDIYLPKLIRAGRRVCICDVTESRKKLVKRGSNETV